MPVDIAGEDRWHIEPLWQGETAVILGSGPSLRQADADYVRGKARVIAINDQCGTAPWADLLYACDKAWWHHPTKKPLHTAFGGIKVSLEATGMADVSKVDPLMHGNSYVKTGLSFDPGVIVGGGNSGYQAINIAVQLGVKRIILLGYDMKMGKRGKTVTVHNHGPHPSPLNNPTEAHFKLWRANYETLVDDAIKAGVEIINATPDSVLRRMAKQPLRECL